MGRGNVCVHNDYEGLYYVDWDNFAYEFEDEDGEVFIDYDHQRYEWEDSLNIFKQDFKKRFNSFTDCDEWIGREERAILESELFYIAVEDNEWSIAIKLLQKETPYHWSGSIENLQKKHYKNYLKGMEECLFNQFEKLGVYGGAWISGSIKRNSDDYRSV